MSGNHSSSYCVQRDFQKNLGLLHTYWEKRRQLDRPMILILKDVNAETDLKWHQACVEAGTKADMNCCHHSVMTSLHPQGHDLWKHRRQSPLFQLLSSSSQTTLMQFQQLSAIFSLNQNTHLPDSTLPCPWKLAVSAEILFQPDTHVHDSRGAESRNHRGPYHSGGPWW